MKYEVFLPLPPACLSPNARPHWAQRSKAVKAYRAECALLFRRAIAAGALPRVLATPVTIHLKFFTRRMPDVVKRYHPLDADNGRSSCKAAQDSLRDAGLIPDDGAKYVRTGFVDILGTKKLCGEMCGVLMILETPESEAKT